MTRSSASPMRWAVLAAVVGSLGIGVIGTGSALLLAFVALSFASESGASELPVALALTGLGALVIGSGWYLLVGYWRIWRGRLPDARQSRLWTLSALYNGAGLLFVTGSVLSMTLYTLEQTLLVGLAVSWLVFMMALSVHGVRQARRSDLAG